MLLVLEQGLRVVLAGIVVGVAAALAIGRFFDSLIYGVTSADPLTLSIAAVTLLVVAIAAALVPARRAARLDPLEAIRRG